MLRFKDESDMRKHGLAVDPEDPTRAVSIGQLVKANWTRTATSPTGETSLRKVMPPEVSKVSRAKLPLPRLYRLAAGKSRHRSSARRTKISNDKTAISPPARPTTEATAAQDAGSAPPRTTQSFARETLVAIGDISGWDDTSLLTGIQKECEAIRGLDSNYPARYHRLGTFRIEGRKRFGDEHVTQVLRQEGIDGTMAWCAEQIATLYTFEQAAAFPSLRAILATLPVKQPRKPKPKAGPAGDGGNQGAVLHEPHQGPLPVATEETITDRFVRLGIELRESLGDEAFHQAVERIKTHVPETFEDAFEEV